MSDDDFKGGFAFTHKAGEEVPDEVKRAFIEKMKREPSTIRAVAKAVGKHNFQTVAKANAMIQGGGKEQAKKAYNGAKRRLAKGAATALDREVIRIYETTEKTATDHRVSFERAYAEKPELPNILVQHWSQIVADYKVYREIVKRPSFWNWLAEWMQSNLGKRYTPDGIRKAAKRLKLDKP